jgi:hypothetical protein
MKGTFSSPRYSCLLEEEHQGLHLPDIPAWTRNAKVSTS